jgi:hypothetical protein
MTKKKLDTYHFYAQFHGLEHHNDSEDHVKTKHHLHNPEAHKAHKGFNIRGHANAKRKPMGNKG